MHTVLLIANGFFWVFHTLLIGFNLFGWLWKPTRKWNLITLALTCFSWLVMGYWYGVGYCICTDWHFQIRAQLGIIDHADTYIQLMGQKLTGATIPTSILNPIAGALLCVSVVGSIWLNIRDRKNYTA